MTIRQNARRGVMTPEMESVAKQENISAKEILAGVANGQIAIPGNNRHKPKLPRGVGKGLSTKVNVNLGASAPHCSLEEELEKLEIAVRYEADAVMDLSLGPLPTDLAAGYDHIAGAIGGALAAMHGADFLCYLTPSEHLRLPTLEDVREGLRNLYGEMRHLQEPSLFQRSGKVHNARVGGMACRQRQGSHLLNGFGKGAFVMMGGT